MQNVIAMAELVGIIGITFSVAAILELILLHGIIQATFARLKPIENRGETTAAKRGQR